MIDTTSSGEVTVTLYTAYLEDLGRIGARHEAVRKFYVTLISTLFVFLSLAAPDGPLFGFSLELRALGSVVGILICVSWMAHTQAFSSILAAKLGTLRRAEKAGQFAHPLFTWEREIVAEKGGRLRVTSVDKVVGGIFLLLFVVLLLIG